MLKGNHIELLHEYGDDLEKLLDAFIEARGDIQEAESAIGVLENKIESLEKEMDEHECNPE